MRSKSRLPLAGISKTSNFSTKHFDLKTCRHEWIFFYLHLAGENISNLPSRKQGVRTNFKFQAVNGYGKSRLTTTE